MNAAASFTNAGMLVLTAGGCGNIAQISMPAGSTLTNSGTIASNAGSGGSRNLVGAGAFTLLNSGTLALNTTTSFNTFGATLTNQGALSIAAGQQLTANGGETINNNAGGTISGGGVLLVQGGVLDHGAGTITLTSPVQLVDSNLNLLSGNALSVDWQGTGALSGNVAAGQSLTLDSTCTRNAIVNAAASFTNSGTLLMTASGCGNISQLSLPGKTMTNKGTLQVDAGSGGTRVLNGNLTNQKLVQVAAGLTLQVVNGGAYTQTSTGQYKTLIDASGNRGQLSVSGTATLAGTLAIGRNPAFQPTSGSFLVISAATRTGTVAKETGAVIAKTRYFLPGYTATTATLDVTTASMTGAPSKGHGGTNVVLSGAGFPPNDTIVLTFTDFNLVTTTYPSATTDGTGAFSANITIPAGAALGAGKIKAKSTFAGVTGSKKFTVN